MSSAHCLSSGVIKDLPNDLLSITPSARTSVASTPNQHKKPPGLCTRLPFIFGPSTIDMLPAHGHHDEFSLLKVENLDHLSHLAYAEDEDEDENEEQPRDEYYLNIDAVLNADGSLIAFTGMPTDNRDDAKDICLPPYPTLKEFPHESSKKLKGTLQVRFAPSFNQSWTDRVIALPPDIGAFRDVGAFIEQNGTVTMVLDTCANSEEDTVVTQNTSCFTVVEAKDGCTVEDCDSWRVVGTVNFLPVPRNCSLDHNDPSFECPCHIEHPTIWYDKPLKRWRMLMHQYPSRLVDGRCVPQPH